ncbi:MAG: hypothetical protein GY801_18555 [bacterium]|nr:hypothetical protein [bacterium]
MKKRLIFFVTISLCLVAATVWADTLEMKNGQLLEGKYVGGTQYSIRFQLGKKVKVFPVQDVLALTFSALSGKKSSETSSAFPTKSSQINTPTPKPQPKPGKKDAIVLEPGTKLSVFLSESIYLKNSRKDDWFRGTLESAVLVNGMTVLPKGARVNGQIVRSRQEQTGSTLAITLREVVMDNQVIPLSTSNYKVQDKAKNVLDLGVSTLRIVKRDRDLQIPYKSVLEFEMTEAIEFRRAQ